MWAIYFWDCKGCILWLLVCVLLLEMRIPNMLHSLLLKLCQNKHVVVVFQGDSRMFAKQVWPEIVWLNHRTWLQAVTIWADNWVICTRGCMRIPCCGTNGELHKICTWAFLHVNSKSTCLPFCPSQNNLAKGCQPKTQPTWFRKAIDWGVIKYISTNVLHNVLSISWIESHNRFIIWTYHVDMINRASIQTSVLHHKTGFLWYTLMLCNFNTSSMKTHYLVLNMENNQWG